VDGRRVIILFSVARVNPVYPPGRFSYGAYTPFRRTVHLTPCWRTAATIAQSSAFIAARGQVDIANATPEFRQLARRPLVIATSHDRTNGSVPGATGVRIVANPAPESKLTPDALLLATNAQALALPGPIQFSPQQRLAAGGRSRER